MAKIPFTLEAWLNDMSRKVVDEDGYSIDPCICSLGWLLERQNSLFIVTPEEELTEFGKAIKNMIKPYAKWPDDVFKEESAKLLSLAREQFIKDGYVIEKKAFHDAVEKIDGRHKAEMSIEYALHCKIENGTRHAVMNWNEFQKVAQHFIDCGKAEALKDLPRWKKAYKACYIGDSIIVDEYGYYRSDTVKPGCHYILISDIEKLPGFKEVEK